MWNHGWGWGWSGWILTGLAMVVFWAVVITLVILAIRCFTSERSGAGTTRPAPGPNRAEDLLGGVDGVARDRVDPAGDQCGSFGGVDGGAPGRRCRAAACPGRAFLGRTTSAGVLGTRTPLSPVRRRLILARTRPSSSPNAATRTTAMTTNIMSGFRSRERPGRAGSSSPMRCLGGVAGHVLRAAPTKSSPPRRCSIRGAVKAVTGEFGGDSSASQRFSPGWTVNVRNAQMSSM